MYFDYKIWVPKQNFIKMKYDLEFMKFKTLFWKVLRKINKRRCYMTKEGIICRDSPYAILRSFRALLCAVMVVICRPVKVKEAPSTRLYGRVVYLEHPLRFRLLIKILQKNLFNRYNILLTVLATEAGFLDKQLSNKAIWWVSVLSCCSSVRIIFVL